MKRLLAIGAMLVAPLGCVGNQGDAFIRFLENRGNRYEGGNCVTVPNTYISAGELDLSGGGNYLMTMAVETNTNQRDLSINNEIFSGEGLNDITIRELVHTYELSDTSLGITLPAEELVPVYAVFRPQTDPVQSFLSIYTLGPGALQALRNYFLVRPSFPLTPAVTVLASIKGRAYLSSGQRTETNVFTYPITVYASSFKDTGCPAGSPVIVQRCGSPGQGGPVQCTSGS